MIVNTCAWLELSNVKCRTSRPKQDPTPRVHVLAWDPTLTRITSLPSHDFANSNRRVSTFRTRLTLGIYRGSSYPNSSTTKNPPPVFLEIEKSTMSDSEDNSTADSGDFPLPPESINPYTVLCIPPTSTVNEIRAAYRRLALQTHPDKVPPAEREAAHVNFQEVAFAYAILNDQDRRARYDATGSTSENVFEEGFDWKDFFRAQVKDLVSPEAVEKFKKEYQGLLPLHESLIPILTKYRIGRGAFGSSTGVYRYQRFPR